MPIVKKYLINKTNTCIAFDNTANITHFASFFFTLFQQDIRSYIFCTQSIPFYLHYVSTKGVDIKCVSRSVPR